MDERELQALLITPPMTDEEKEFHAWMKLNRNTFHKYGSDEVFTFAKWNGFSEGLIFAQLSHYTDALNGSSTERRAKLLAFTFDAALEHTERLKRDLEKQPDYLNELWLDVHECQTGEVA